MLLWILTIFTIENVLAAWRNRADGARSCDAVVPPLDKEGVEGSEIEKKTLSVHGEKKWSTTEVQLLCSLPLRLASTYNLARDSRKLGALCQEMHNFITQGKVRANGKPQAKALSELSNFWVNFTIIELCTYCCICVIYKTDMPLTCYAHTLYTHSLQNIDRILDSTRWGEPDNYVYTCNLNLLVCVCVCVLVSVHTCTYTHACMVYVKLCVKLCVCTCRCGIAV